MKTITQKLVEVSAAFLLLFAGSLVLAEEDIDLADVPNHVMAAAMAAVAGIEITEAEIEEEDGQTIYELEGEANGTEYEIEVAADGTVLEVEEDD